MFLLCVCMCVCVSELKAERNIMTVSVCTDQTLQVLTGSVSEGLKQEAAATQYFFILNEKKEHIYVCVCVLDYWIT